MAKMDKMLPAMKKLGPKVNKVVEKTAVTAKPKSSTTATTGKIKIGNAKVSTSGGPKPKTSVSGTSMASGTKVTKPKPMTEAQKQAKALDALQAKRAAAEKKTGSRPNYRTN